MMNQGVKALLSWVDSLKLSDKPLKIDDLKDGEILLKLIHRLKKETHYNISDSVEERFHFITEFLQKECRYNPSMGSYVSWDGIKNGSKLTVEIAKVLLLLVYHDMMNERCTLSTLECEMEKQLAFLTVTFVLESDGGVYLSERIDYNLAMKRLSFHKVNELPESTSSSNMSAVSFSDEDSPVFQRTKTVTFVDIETVASSSVGSPLMEIMNTPKFQMRKMQRQLIKERDFRDGLEKELANTLTLVKQRESQINQLQYNNDRLKEEKGSQEQTMREQINELETKNGSLQTRFNELLNQNKELKNTSALMERKVDELTEESGILSSQLRALCSQLTISEAEVKRLTQTHASAEEDWRSENSRLMSELNQATAQKELLTEQIQILQGKLSCLEDEVKKATKEEEGENMGPVMERMLETEISSLKNELDSTLCSLTKAEVDIQTKNQKMFDYQLEINRLQQYIAVCEQDMAILKEAKKESRDLLNQTEEKVKDLDSKVLAATSLITSKEQEIFHLKEEVNNLTADARTAKNEMEKLKSDHCKDSEVLNNEIQNLKKLLQSLSESLDALQIEMGASQDEVTRLNAEISAKEEQLFQLRSETSAHSESLQQEIEALNMQIKSVSNSLETSENQVKAKEDLMAKQEQESALQIEELRKHSTVVEDKVNQLKQEIQTKEDEVIVLKSNHSNEVEALQSEIQALKDQVQCLSESLKSAADQVQAKENLLVQKEMVFSEEKNTFETVIATSEEEIRRLKEEIQTTETQLASLKQESSTHSDMQLKEIKSLQELLDHTSESLRKAEEKVQTQLTLINQQEQESAHQKELLQQQLSASEEEVKNLKMEIQTKEQQMCLLENQSSKEAQQLHQEIKDLKRQVEDLGSLLTKAEESLQVKDNLFAEQQLQSTKNLEALHVQMGASQDEVKKLNAEISAKEEQLVQLRSETSAHSESLQQEIEALKMQIKSVSNSLETSENQVKAKEDLMAKQEQESALQIEELRKHSTVVEDKVNQLKQEIQTKEDEVIVLKSNHSNEVEALQSEIQALKDQVQCLSESLKSAADQVQAKENLLVQKEMVFSEKKNTFETVIATSEEEIRRLKEEIQTTEAQLASLKQESSTHSDMQQKEMKSLQQQLDHTSESLRKAEEKVQTQLTLINQQEQESAHQKELLQQRLQESTLQIEELRKLCDISDDKSKQLKREIQAKEDIFVAEKEVLMAKILKGETDQKLLKKQCEALMAEKDSLINANQVTGSEVRASHMLKSALQKELELLKKERKQLKQMAEGTEEMKWNLEQQLVAQSEAAEHYKAQMEKAVSHYNSKKQLLQKSENEVKELRLSLEVKEHETNALIMEKKLLKADLNKVHSNEKKLLSMVASLEAQVAYADQTLRARNKIHGSESCVTRAGICTRSQLRKSMSSDSLDQSSLEDSLSVTRKLSAPDVSSTPLVRSSQRLAAKRRGLEAESLETLYFTPLNSRQTKRSATSDTELDSTHKTPSSVKRRKTTQVVNITMTKSMPGSCEEDETFHSVATSSSHQKPSSAHSVRPELSDVPASKTSAANDQLIGLPGYRRSTIHSQTTGTFCVGAENEPDGGPEDWLRIAELQSRNKACLPHMKSSYPVEFETGGSTAFFCTDEELRHGDPIDTIRRGSMIPGQLLDSVTSHRQSLMLGQAGVGTRSHRLSLMPGQLPAKRTSSCQQQSLKGKSSSSLSVYQMSPEKKTRASCFPRPLTPKNKNACGGPTSNNLRPALSPADRRQSMMFTIDNTPKSSINLRKKLKKLHSSSRKSPATRAGSSKSPQSARKKSAKSPGLTASARKKRLVKKNSAQMEGQEDDEED